jgi:uncharacterized protein (DUF305 family)
VGLGDDRHAGLHPQLAALLFAVLLVLTTACASETGGAASIAPAPTVTPLPEYTKEPDVTSVASVDASSAQAKPYDREFIDTAVPLLQAEVEMAQIALGRAHHLELRDMAHEMIDTDSVQIGDMQLWRRTWFGSSETPPMTLMSQIDSLRNAADPFDTAFIDETLPLQRQGMDDAREALVQAGTRQVLQLAGEMLVDRSRFALEMQGLRSKW